MLLRPWPGPPLDFIGGRAEASKFVDGNWVNLCHDRRRILEDSATYTAAVEIVKLRKNTLTVNLNIETETY